MSQDHVDASTTLTAATKRPKGVRYPIESVVNAARVLGFFTDLPQVRITDVAETLKVSPSTAHRLLTSLEASALVEQDETTRCYRPGPGLLAIAAALVPTGSQWSFARPYVAELAERVGHTVNIMLRHERDVSFAESVESSSLVRVGSRLGAVMPAHTTSGGKILLATASEDEWKRLYPDPVISHRLASSTVERDSLFATLRAAAQRGYATNFSESEAGISGVAVPVRAGSRGDFALAVSVPAARLSKTRVEALVEDLQVTAAALSASANS